MPPRPQHTHLPALVLTVLTALSCSGHPGADREAREPAPPPPETGGTQETTPEPEEPASPPESAPETFPEHPSPAPAPDPGPKPVPVAPQPPPPGAEIVWGKKFIPAQNSKLPAKWTTCKKDEDCMVMDVECCDSISVNQKYAKQAREKLPHTMCDMECGMESGRGVCMKGRCGAQLGTYPGLDVF